MFSCSAVSLALGLYDVAAGVSSLVDSGPLDVFLSVGEPKQHFLTGALLL